MDKLVQFVRRNPISTGLLVFCMIQIVAFLYYINFFKDNNYLPSPFIYDKSDTFMDLFHTLYWSNNSGRYTEWLSVYPPLVFLVLKFVYQVFYGDETFINAFELREQTNYFIYFFIGCALLAQGCVFRTPLWSRLLVHQRLLLFLISVLSTPFLFALERGNLILFCPILIAIALSGKPIEKVVCIAILINLKPYFALLMAVFALKRDWSNLLKVIVFSGFLYLATGLVTDKFFILFLQNLLSFGSEDDLFSLREVMAMPSSLSAFSYILSSGKIGEEAIYNLAPTMLSSFIELYKWFLIAILGFTLYKRSKSIDEGVILAGLILITSNLGIWVGGYTFILYVPLIPIFLRLKFKVQYVLIFFAIFAPLDLIPLVSESIGKQYVYLSGVTTDVNWTLGLGSIMRPILNSFLLVLFTYEIFTASKAKPYLN